MAAEFKRSVVHFDVKSIGDDGAFSGYGAVFGNIDLDGDVIKKGAFKKSLSEWRKRKKLPPVVWQHQFSEPIGPHTLMEEDDRGLKTEGILLIDDIPRARQARALLKANAIDGLSIGFSVRMAVDDRKMGARVLTEIDLYEVSIVTAAANPEATVTAVKGDAMFGSIRIDKLTTPKEFEELLREAGFSKSAAVAFIAKCRRQGEPVEEKAAADIVSLLQKQTNHIRRITK